MYSLLSGANGTPYASATMAACIEPARTNRAPEIFLTKLTMSSRSSTVGRKSASALSSWIVFGVFSVSSSTCRTAMASPLGSPGETMWGSW